MEGDIEVDGQRVTVSLGLHRVGALCALAGKDAALLFLHHAGQAATPLSPSDVLLVRGRERLVKGAVAADDAPRLATPTLNGQPIEIQSGKATAPAIKEHDADLPGGRLFLEFVGDVDVEIPDDVTIVVREEDVYFVVPPSSDGGDAIDLEACGKHNRRPPRGHKYRVRIDGAKHTLEAATATGAEILALVDKNAHDWSLNRKLHGGRRERIEPEEIVDFCAPGVERFETVRRQAQQGHG